MLNRTSPKRLTFIVIALILGILLGLAFFPAADLSGAAPLGICDTVIGIPSAECQVQDSFYDGTNGPSWTNRAGDEDLSH